MAQLISEMGDWLYSVAIYSLILEVTNSARAVAFAFMLQVLPQTFVAPAAGVLNDRLSRRKVMIFADCARAVITFLHAVRADVRKLRGCSTSCSFSKLSSGPCSSLAAAP